MVAHGSCYICGLLRCDQGAKLSTRIMHVLLSSLRPQWSGYLFNCKSDYFLDSSFVSLTHTLTQSIVLYVRVFPLFGQSPSVCCVCFFMAGQVRARVQLHSLSLTHTHNDKLTGAVRLSLPTLLHTQKATHKKGVRVSVGREMREMMLKMGGESSIFFLPLFFCSTSLACSREEREHTHAHEEDRTNANLC